MGYFIKQNRCGMWLWYIQADMNLYMVMALIVVLSRTPIRMNLLLVGSISVSIVFSCLIVYLMYKRTGMLAKAVLHNQLICTMAIYLAGGLLGYNLKLMNDKKKSKKDKMGMEVADFQDEGEGNELIEVKREKKLIREYEIFNKEAARSKSNKIK